MELHWLTVVDAIMVGTLLLGAPFIAAVIGHRTYKGWTKTFDRQSFFFLFLGTLAAASVLFVAAQRMNADVRTPLFLVQVLCVELGAVLFGVAGGCLLGVFLYRLGLSQPRQGDQELQRHDPVCRPRYWVLIILAVNLLDVLLLAEGTGYGREGPDTFQSVVLFLQFIALGGCYWMLADWFFKKGQRQFKKWMWLVFIPWGWLWYCFEVRPFIKVTDETTV